MTIFAYSIKTKEGKMIKGTLEAESNDKALEYLHSQGSIILSLKEQKAKKVISIR